MHQMPRDTSALSLPRHTLCQRYCEIVGAKLPKDPRRFLKSELLYEIGDLHRKCQLWPQGSYATLIYTYHLCIHIPQVTPRHNWHDFLGNNAGFPFESIITFYGASWQSRAIDPTQPGRVRARVAFIHVVLILCKRVEFFSKKIVFLNINGII